MGFWETIRAYYVPQLAASLVVGLACALVGVHVVSRRLVVVGVALPQVAAFGIALSFLCADWPLLGNHDFAAIAAETIGVAVLALAAPRAKLGQDALAGVLFVSAAAGTILLGGAIPAGLEEVRHLVEGNVLAIHAPDLVPIGAILGAVVVAHVAFLRRLLLVTFDRETAATVGVRTRLWDVVFFATLAMVSAWGVHATGTLFVFGYLLLPAAAGLTLGRGVGGVFGTAAASALLGAGGGFLLSVLWDTPTGPTCVAAALVLLGVAIVAARLRGR